MRKSGQEKPDLPALEQAYGRLKNWSKSLQIEVNEMWPQVLDALKKNTKLPEGCPSHASMALLILRGVQQKLDEVNAAFKETDDAIRHVGY